MHSFNGMYDGEHLNHVAMPMGGLGAGMICLEGTGAISHVSVRNKPDIFNEPQMFAAVCVKGCDGRANVARVVEGPMPQRKIFGNSGSGHGLGHRAYGLPRFHQATFRSHMPFGEIALCDHAMPVSAKITGWSPFIPTDADASSLPVAGLEYELTNPTTKTLEGVFSYHARNFMEVLKPLVDGKRDVSGMSVRRVDRGFVLHQPGWEGSPEHEGSFAVLCDSSQTRVDAVWFRSGWFDSLTMLWKHVEACEVVEHDTATDMPSPGGSLYVPFKLAPGQSQTFRVLMCWHVAGSDSRCGSEATSCCSSGCGDKPAEPKPMHKPWYAGVFKDIDDVCGHWRKGYDDLRARTLAFTDCFHDTTLPPEVVEAIAANLTILKSPTVLRQTDGRVWAWEGCCDVGGCCYGSCTHVWNYAQALPHLFPSLERTLRQTEFNEAQNAEGKQLFRASLPIRPTVDFDCHAAADGQFGGIMKVHRDWRVSGDDNWLRGIWPKVRKSMEYCIGVWDPDHEGILKEPHHNTYDIEFWGPDGMCESFYLGALVAACAMGKALGEDVKLFAELCDKCKKHLESELFNGEYFQQQVRWKDLHADPHQFKPLIGNGESPEIQELLEAEGPKYQYASGCLSDGILGAWMADVCYLGDILDRAKLTRHLKAIHTHNMRYDLSEHACPQRPGFAMGQEGGLLVCTWPRGGKPTLPFVYCDEVFTGIEYQVASHLMRMGCVSEGLDIVREARKRYDGRVRNPFNEYECGHWYARAMSSYALIFGLTGIRYDAVEKKLTIKPTISGDFRAFLCTATGFGTVGLRDGKPFVEVKYGKIDVKTIDYKA
ncbi:MAG: hypothetical protein IT440_09755 [Phycisphaeraceae bacterium]|nr:hypothetical protein [Phycisphaeraceae bacterium]